VVLALALVVLEITECWYDDYASICLLCFDRAEVGVDVSCIAWRWRWSDDGSTEYVNVTD
jgi:hypothetical protein